MSDIVDRLRDLFLSSDDPDARYEDELALEAADLIERQRAVIEAARALDRYRDEGSDEDWNDWDEKFDAMSDALRALDGDSDE